MSFFIFARKNYIKLPLVAESLLEQMSATDAPLYHTFCETSIWVDDWYNEHRMCLLRPAFSGLNTPEEHRKAAFIQENRRLKTMDVRPRASKNSLSEDSLNNYKAKTAEFLAEVSSSIFRRWDFSPFVMQNIIIWFAPQSHFNHFQTCDNPASPYHRELLESHWNTWRSCFLSTSCRQSYRNSGTFWSTTTSSLRVAASVDGSSEMSDNWSASIDMEFEYDSSSAEDLDS